MAASRRPTIRDVARRSGFSVGTVSRALNGYSDVAEQTRARVLQVASELEYQPESAARSLVTRRSHVIGVFLETGADHPDLQHPFFHEVLVGLKGAVGRAGYDLLLFAREQSNNVFGNQSCLDRCRQHGVDGAVLIGTPDEAGIRGLVRSEVPCVGIDLDLGEGGTLVASDNVAGAKLAVDHLYDLGHRRIATITGLLHTRPGADRLQGYREALQGHRLAYRDEYVTYGDYYVDSGSQAMEELLGLGDEAPTAVFAAADLMAIGAIRAATAAGVRVPDELSVVGYDDISLAEHLQPPLTTVSQDKLSLGARGGQALVDQIEGNQQQPSPVTLPVEVVVRKSTAAAPTGPDTDEDSSGTNTDRTVGRRANNT